jgi:hypothetical protein
MVPPTPPLAFWPMIFLSPETSIVTTGKKGGGDAVEDGDEDLPPDRVVQRQGEEDARPMRL